MSVPVIAIDGPSGSGKGTVSRRVASALGWQLLDSGALYRLVGLAAEQTGLSPDRAEDLASLARTLNIRFEATADGDELIRLDGEDVTAEIRTEFAGERASKVAAVPAVRSALMDLQLGFRSPPGLVADGRDMGTTVFPDAPLKVFLTASAEERAKRRHKQLKLKGIDVNLAALSRDIEARDQRDSQRSVAPLVPADDARLLDSSDLSIESVTETVLGWAREIGIS
ncbi:MAG: (d)CMP kinase [Pseudomonadota bacterium]